MKTSPKPTACDPLVCGIDGPCDYCRANAAPRELTDDDRVWALQLAHGWARRPQPLDRDERRNLLLRLADVRETARRDPEFAAEVADGLAALVGVGVEALTKRIVPTVAKTLVREAVQEEVARRIADELPSAATVAIENELVEAGRNI